MKATQSFVQVKIGRLRSNNSSYFFISTNSDVQLLPISGIGSTTVPHSIKKHFVYSEMKKLLYLSASEKVKVY